MFFDKATTKLVRSPFAAPSTGVEGGIAREGGAQDARHSAVGPGMARLQNPTGTKRAGEKRLRGRLFFGYFLLAKQKKVTRLRVREPDSNNRRASDTLTLNQYKSD